ncbi:hypothetical protein, partial [Proteus mirabilis]|uniref:hypothetical protein n=1 Tax=Proteus mirabilis TaxID=584 RepID=UPI0015C581BE
QPEYCGGPFLYDGNKGLLALSKLGIERCLSVLKIRKGVISSGPKASSVERKEEVQPSLDKELAVLRSDPTEAKKQRALWSKVYVKQAGRRPSQWCNASREEGCHDKEIGTSFDSDIEVDSEEENLSCPGSVDDRQEGVNTEDFLQDLSCLFLDRDHTEQGCSANCEPRENIGEK